jgi:hypothetical protein
MTIFYPDVSSYQAGISFAGCVIAVAKATEGTGYTNPDYAAAKVRAANADAFFWLITSCAQAMGRARRPTPKASSAATSR